MPRPKKKHRNNPVRIKKNPTFHGLFRFRKHIIMYALYTIGIGGFFIYTIVQSEPLPTRPPDDRPARIDAYFTKRNMPLAGYGEYFVTVADQCGIDWRLLPAIAVRESSGGKRLQNNNPFGWGGARIPFQHFKEAIDTVGLNLCGNNPNTAQWYSTTSTYKKLYYYNGQVIPTYPTEVMWIMDQF